MKVICPAGDQGRNNPSFFNETGTNPLLRIQDLPEATESLAVIAENSQSHKIRWVVYNIPVTDIIEENFQKGIEAVNDFSRDDLHDPRQGETDWAMTYSVYALDDVLNIGGGKECSFILNAMKKHLLDKAEITVEYGPPFVATGALSSHGNSGFPLGRHD